MKSSKRRGKLRPYAPGCDAEMRRSEIAVPTDAEAAYRAVDWRDRSLERRDLFRGALAAGLFAAPQLPSHINPSSDIVVERAVSGAPHQGKTLAVITPHLDDGPFFACGTVAKLLREGYTGYFIRTSNDEKDSYDLSLGETVLANERDAKAFLQASGLKQMFDLSYRNHRMDDLARTEIRARLIFLFRLLKIDTVFSYDPWGHYEENPDHYVTAQAVEAACWMSGGHLDMPEHFAAGFESAQCVREILFRPRPAACEPRGGYRSDHSKPNSPACDHAGP